MSAAAKRIAAWSTMAEARRVGVVGLGIGTMHVRALQRGPYECPPQQCGNAESQRRRTRAYRSIAVGPRPRARRLVGVALVLALVAACGGGSSGTTASSQANA